MVGRKQTSQQVRKPSLILAFPVVGGRKLKTYQEVFSLPWKARPEIHFLAPTLVGTPFPSTARSLTRLPGPEIDFWEWRECPGNPWLAANAGCCAGAARCKISDRSFLRYAGRSPGWR